MATKLTKPLSRKVVIMTDNRMIPRPQDTVTVTVSQSHISFKPYHSRDEYVLPMYSAYMAAKEIHRRQKAEGAKGR